MFSKRAFNQLRYFFATSKRTKVFMDISIDGEAKGRMVFELYDDIVPKTAENFKRLCLGITKSSSGDNLLHYKGTKFYRIIPGFMSQGGDVTKNDGTGGESVFGPTFPDENYKVSFNKSGMLGMVNKGPNSNASNFFITHIDCSFLDGKYVGFGELVDGKSVLNQIEYSGDMKGGKPKKEVVIIDCGVIGQSGESQ